MIITLIGKQHLKGKSQRTGNDYDFINVHFIGKENGVEGQCGQRLTVDPSLVDYASLKVGERYYIELGLRGRVVEICLASKKGL